MAAEIDTITVREAKSLADRLAGWGLSRLEKDTPEQQNDLLLAARTIRAMARSFNDLDPLRIEGGNPCLGS